MGSSGKEGERQPPKPPIKLLRTRLSALLEAVGFYALLLLYDALYGDGHRYIDVGLHPFWIAVLIISAHYGTLEGMAAAALGTLFLYVGNIPEQNVEETLLHYQIRMTLIPLLWFFVAFFLGEIRAKLLYDKYKLEMDAYKERGYAEAITMEYEELKLRYESLLSHITSEKATVAKAIEVLKDMERSTPSLILSNLKPVIEFAVNPDKFSVYAVGNQGLEAVFAVGWEDEEPYERRFGLESGIYKRIVKEKATLCIVNQEEKELLAGQGMLASALINPADGAVFGMIKIEKLNVKNLNLSMIRTFRMVSGLIGVAYMNAAENKRNREVIYKDVTTGLLTYNFYLYEKPRYLQLCKELSAPLHEIKIAFPQLSATSPSEEVIALIDAIVKRAKRPEVEIFLGKVRSLEMLFLIPFKEQAWVEALREEVRKVIDVQKSIVDVEYYTHVKALFQPQKKASLH